MSGSTFTGNSALYGGALAVDSWMDASSSTFSGNSAEIEGAGIANYGSLVVESSTFKGNTSAGLGGAIANYGTFTLVNSTLYGNSASSSGGALYTKSPPDGWSTAPSPTTARPAVECSSTRARGWSWRARSSPTTQPGVRIARGTGLTPTGTCTSPPPPTITVRACTLIPCWARCRTMAAPPRPWASASGVRRKTRATLRAPLRPCFPWTSAASPGPSARGATSARSNRRRRATCRSARASFIPAALRTDGSVDCWGANGYDQATDKVGPYVEVSAGDMYNLGLKGNGNVDVWGSENYEMVYGPYKQVAAGDLHSCALRRDSTIQCWGRNFYGQANNQSGSYLQVTVGEDHSCALRTNGGAYCWGNQAYDITGDRPGPYKYISAGGYHVCAVKATDGTVECWGANGYGQSKPPAGAFVAVAGGLYHTCGIKVDGTLACWGYNLYGQTKPPAGQYKQVESGMGDSCAISMTNEAVCWGRNDYGQTKVPVIGGPTASESFDFEGFYPPVEPDPALNVVKAGSSVPLKFSLGGDQGLDVLAAGSPASAPLDCATLEPGGDLVPAKSAGGSALGYDPRLPVSTPTSGRRRKRGRARAACCPSGWPDDTEHRVAFRFK